MDARTTEVGRLALVPTRGRRPAAAVVVVVAAFLLLRAIGGVQAIDTALQVMGFDVDRAKLLTSLTVEALVVATGVLATRAALAASMAGVVVGAAIFARTFTDETGQATTIPAGAATVFDPLGWVITILTLLAAFTIVAWAAATIALHVRTAALLAVADVRAFREQPRERQHLVRPIGAVLAIAVLFVALPVFADMVNYAPDVRMRVGGPSDLGLAEAARGSVATSDALPSGTVGAPTILGAAASAGAGSGPGAVVASARP